MSIKTRISKLEQKVLPVETENIEVFYCLDSETRKEAGERLGLDLNDGVLRMFLRFG